MKIAIISLLIVKSQSFSPTSCAAPRGRPSIQLNYFDDASRKSNHLDNKLDITSDLWKNVVFVSQGDEVKTPEYKNQKLEALQKTLFGYDLSSTTALKKAEIDGILEDWIEKVDFAKEYLQLEYDANVGIHIDSTSSLVGCYSKLWNHISSYANNPEKSSEYDIEMILFPLCPELYKYENMARMMKDLETCASFCSKFGKDFSIDSFHPTYENEPAMLNPTKHSPFPCFGIRRSRLFSSDVNEALRSTGTSTSVDKEIDTIFSDITNETRNELEKLFSSKAASKSDELHMDDLYESDTQLSDEHYTSEMKEWMDSISKTNSKALKYANVIDDRWIISRSALEESLYCEIWTNIHQHMVDSEEAQNDEKLTSFVFIPINFLPYNAQRFKKIAISMNKSLVRHASNGGVYIGELFHPEFVGSDDAQSELRRSPFPAIQIIFEKNN